jgi:hypothetical protein
VRVPVVVGVTLTEQVAEAVVPASVQVPPGVKVTVPVGVVAPDVDVSVIVAVQLVAWLTKTVDGLHATVVVVGWVPTAIVAVPELVAWTALPL